MPEDVTKRDRPLLLPLPGLSFPSSPEQLFGRDRPIVLEIGIGSGRFTEHLAGHFPAWNVLGVERAPASVTRAYRRLHRAGVSNARLFKGDAHFLLRHVIGPGHLRRVYVNFPDPWPRSRHRHRRLLQAAFFELLASRLDDQGALLLTTDDADYFRFAREQARASGLFREEVGPPPPGVLRTKYARKWQSHQRSFFHVAFFKTGEAPCAPSDLERLPMHHAVLTGDLPDLTAFEPLVHPFDGGHIIVREAYRALDGEGLVFFVHTEEPNLSQEFLVEARAARNGTVVGLKRFGEPLYTRAVSEAVHVLTAWLEAHGMEILHRRY